MVGPTPRCGARAAQLDVDGRAAGVSRADARCEISLSSVTPVDQGCSATYVNRRDSVKFAAVRVGFARTIRARCDNLQSADPPHNLGQVAEEDVAWLNPLGDVAGCLTEARDTRPCLAELLPRRSGEQIEP